MRRDGALWQVCRVDSDGKPTPEGFVVLDFVGEGELEQFPENLFHESTLRNSGDAYRIV